MAKNLFPARFCALWPKFCPLKFLLWVLLLLDVIHCCKLSLHAVSRKTNEPNLRKWQKTSFGPDFGPFSPKSGCQFFFSKIWLRQSLSIRTISGKTNDPILRKLSDISSFLRNCLSKHTAI